MTSRLKALAASGRGDAAIGDVYERFAIGDMGMERGKPDFPLWSRPDDCWFA